MAALGKALGGALGWLPLAALAAGAATVGARPADPLDPQAPVPASVHRSALAGYRPMGDAVRVPWPQANDTVARIGGWRAYAREGAAAAAAQAASAPALPGQRSGGPDR